MNVDTFRTNIFLESTMWKGRKNTLYSSLLAIYTVACLWIELRWTQTIGSVILLGLSLVIILGSSAGKAALSRVTRWIPWSKLGYLSLNIVGCEDIATKTAPHLFLHKDSRIGQIKEWLKYKSNAPYKIVLVWAGRVLADEETLSKIGIVNGSAVVALFEQDNLDDLLHLGQDNRATQPRIVRSAVPAEPDADFDGTDEESVPKFIHDMFGDSDDEDEEVGKEIVSPSLADRFAPLLTWLKMIGQSFNREFGDSKWMKMGPAASAQLIPPAPVAPVVVVEEDEEESDDGLEDYDAPSFLREMLSDDDDDDEDDDEEVEETPVVKPSVPLSARLDWLKKAASRSMRWWFGGLKVGTATTSFVRQSKARDVITLMDDDDEIRYTMPCGTYHHSMSQSSLLGYMKNQVLVEKKEKLCCPVPACDNSTWSFGEVCEILRVRAGGDGDEFVLSTNDVTKVETELSANLITKTMNCQRCPSCEVALLRSQKAEDFEVECFACETKFCWSCKAPWSEDFDCCMNPKCGTTWEFVASEMLKNCPRKRLDHMENVPTLRACPECGQLITHVTACKHMRCSLCTTRFCFICTLPQKDGNWQCGYDVNTCKLTEVQPVDALSVGRVARTNVLERVSSSVFEDFQMTDMEEFTRKKKEFIDNVMASVQNPQFFE